MAKKPQRFQMWALFNYNRPPIFIEMTRRECVTQGVNWLGSDSGFRRSRREGSITIEKVTVIRPPSTRSVK